MNAAELTASLKLTNNGYLFAPTGAELCCARANPGLFTVVGGTIYMATHVGPMPDVAYFVREASRDKQVCVTVGGVDGAGELPDYEGAILERQERAGFYD